MQKTTKLGLLMATVALVAACGGTDTPPPAAGTPPPPPPPPPPAVACTAPDPATDLSFQTYVGACIPGAGTTSRRTDLHVSTGFVAEYAISYASSSNCQATNTATALTGAYYRTNVGTTTLAALAADGATPITGVGYQIAVSLAEGTGTLSGVTGTTTFALCKTAPSAPTRTASAFYNSTPNSFSPTFGIRLSLPNTTTIVATPFFDKTPSCLYCD